MASENQESLAVWLEGVQKTMGITYTNDDAEEHLRATFERILRAVGKGQMNSVEYFGFREQPHPDGTRLRTTLRTLSANITMPDGTAYHLRLTGPYEAAHGQ